VAQNLGYRAGGQLYKQSKYRYLKSKSKADLPHHFRRVFSKTSNYMQPLQPLRQGLDSAVF